MDSDVLESWGFGFDGDKVPSGSTTFGVCFQAPLAQEVTSRELLRARGWRQMWKRIKALFESDLQVLQQA